MADPHRYQVRVWVWAKPADPPTAADSRGKDRTTAGRSVTVDLEDAQAGGSIATKTLAARDLDDAAARVAAYVARQIFKADPTAPPWSVGFFDGSDLAALLCAKQQTQICAALIGHRLSASSSASRSRMTTRGQILDLIIRALRDLPWLR